MFVLPCVHLCSFVMILITFPLISFAVFSSICNSSSLSVTLLYSCRLSLFRDPTRSCSCLYARMSTRLIEISKTCRDISHPSRTHDDIDEHLSESHDPRELQRLNVVIALSIRGVVNENSESRYIGFVKNRPPMKALTNHIAPSLSALFSDEFALSSSPSFSFLLPVFFSLSISLSLSLSISSRSTRIHSDGQVHTHTGARARAHSSGTRRAFLFSSTSSTPSPRPTEEPKRTFVR